MVYHNSFRQSRGEGVVKFIELKFFNFVWWERLSSKDICGPGFGGRFGRYFPVYSIGQWTDNRNVLAQKHAFDNKQHLPEDVQ